MTPSLAAAPRSTRTGALAPVLLAWFAATVAMAPGHAGGIYTCTDAQGRRLTSDRPIAECMDREQRELNPSGTVRRIVRPVPTAEERTREAAQQKAQAEAQAKLNEERRKEQLLQTRYPNADVHQQARVAALAEVDDSMAAAHKHAQALDKQRLAIEAELEFYKRDPGKAPEWLKRRQADNAQQRAEQIQHVADLEREKVQINEQFDAELRRLRQLWATPGPR